MAQQTDLKTSRSIVSRQYGPEVAAIFKDSDLQEFVSCGRQPPRRMRHAILKVGAKRAKAQHALHGKCRKHQISDWVPLDHTTIHMRGCLTDWVALYPLGQHASDSEEEEGDLPNLWPVRVAYATYLALVRQADYWTHWMQALDDVEHELPPMAKPYLKDEAWSWDLLQCFLRLADRLSKGCGPQPRCTGEEIAFHMVEESVQADMEEGADTGGNSYFDSLPVHKQDEDVDFWFGMAVQDMDIMFLYDGSYEDLKQKGILDYMGAANLHPVEWYIRFKNMPEQEPPLL